jgi:hypothetical protein
MSITYNLKILELEVVPSVGTYTNVVSRIHARYEAVNEYNVKAFKYYSQNLGPPSESYVELNNLTNEIVEGWMTRFSNSSLRTNWDQQLSEELSQRSTSTILISPPWE